MKRRKAKTIWCYLDGRKHCDVVQWALAADVMVADACGAVPGHGSHVQDGMKGGINRCGS